MEQRNWGFSAEMSFWNLRCITNFGPSTYKDALKNLQNEYYVLKLSYLNIGKKKLFWKKISDGGLFDFLKKKSKTQDYVKSAKDR